MDLQLTTDSSTSSTSSLNTFNSESKGLNVEITPAVAELGTAGTSSTSLLEPSPMVRTYDPSRDINKLQDEAGFFVGTGAYLTEESLYRAIYDSFDEPVFSADNNFNALNAFRTDKAAASLSPDFQEELLGAVSQEDYNHRWKRIKDKQIAQRAMGEAPVGSFTGGMIDADLLLGVGVTKGVRVLSLGTQLGRGSAMLTGAAIGGATVGGVSAATGYRSNEQIMWDAVSGAAGGLLDGFSAVPKASTRMPLVGDAVNTVEVPRYVSPTEAAIAAGNFNRLKEYSPTPRWVPKKSARSLDVETTTGTANTRLIQVDRLQDAAEYSRFVKSGRVVLPDNAKVTYIPEDDLVIAVKGALDTPEGQAELLRELGARASAARVLGAETVFDMIDHVGHLAATGNTLAKDALAYARNAPANYQGITALGRYIELNAHNIDDTVITRALVGVRQWLRKLGLNIDYSDADLVTLIRKAMREAPEHKYYPDKGIVYHGSAVTGIDQLKMQYAKSGEGNQMFGAGHYVTTDEGLANTYRAKIADFKGLDPEDGALYALRRNFDDSEVLDFSTSKQAPKAKAVMQKYNIPSGTGQEQYQALSKLLGSDKAASDALLAGGVKANKFGTAETRAGRSTGMNYVVFADDGLTILKDMSTPFKASTVDSMIRASKNPSTTKIQANQSVLFAEEPAQKSWSIQSILPVKVVDAIDKFNTGFKGYVSSYDKLRNYVGDELANKLLANPVDDVAESAVAYGRSTLLEADRALVGLERAIRAEVPQWKSLRPSTRAAARAETQELGREARQWLNRAQQMEANGITPPPHPNPRVQRIVDAYVKGDFGNIMGKAAQDAGVFGADALTPSKYYVPVRHAYLKMQQFVESGKGSWTDLHKMYGQQIARIYPRLVMPEAQGGLGLSAEAIGKKFVYTQKLRQADPKAQAFRGTTQDELAQVLRAEGIEEGKIKGLLGTLQPKAAEAGKQKHLRHRMDWDYDATFVGSKGKVISISDFMDDDLLGNLQTYARSMSGRIGLARMGFTHDLDLDAALGEALDKLPAAERPQAQAFFSNVRAQLLGQPVGEQAPDWFRTATSYGASVQLGNSGAYAVADYAQLIHEFGITKVTKHFIGAMSNVVKPAAMTKAQAETLQDIMSGQLIAEGRVRPYVTHLEDNWTGPAGSIHELAQYGGQYVRFLNGSEFVRRHQINILAGIMDDLVTQVGAGNAKAVKYFKSVGMSDADLVAMQQQVQKHGTLMDNWDTTVRARSMNAITSAGDNVVMTIRRGEQPAFVEHSAIGRVLFPYMRYVFGATQKILRRNYQRGSATGIALYMSAAVPLSTLSGMLSNIIQGRDPKEDLVARTIRALPAMGLASLVADGFIQGSVGGAAPAFAGPNNLFSIADKAKRGELTVEDVLKAVPGVNTFLPTRMLVNSVNEDD